MIRKGKPSKLSIIFTVLDALLRVAALSIIFFFFAEYFRENGNFLNSTKKWIIIILASPIVFYLVNISTFIYRSYYNYTYSGVHLPLRNKHFTSFITIIIVYSSLFAGLIIFNSKPPILLIPKMKPGTFGIRCWRSIVEVDSLSVAFLDNNNHWKRIPENILYDTANWAFPVMSDNPKAESGNFIPKAEFNPNSQLITLTNCAAVFYPSDSIFTKVFHNIRIKAKVRYKTVDSDKATFPGFEFVTFIDTIFDSFVVNNVGKKVPKFSELCLQFNLNFYDKPNPWIPDLDWLPSKLNTSPEADLIKYGNFTVPLQRLTWYKISGIVYDDQVLFLGHNAFGTCTLFETRINSPSDEKR